MTRVGQDYIRDDARRADLPKLRWLVLACALPAVVGSIAMTARTNSGPADHEADASGADAGPPLATAGGGQSAGIQLLDASIVPLADDPGGGRQSRSDSASPAQASDKTQTTGPRWIQVDIQRGDTLSLAFERHGLSYRDSLAVAHLDEYGKHFTGGLKAGDQLRVRATDNGDVQAIDYPLSAVRTLEVRTTEDGYKADVTHAEVNRRKAYAIGTINDSFYVDALQAGLSDKVIMNLAHIFSWDIDFVHDIQKGDHFIVVYEQLYRDGNKIRDGHILAAEFTSQGDTLRAIRYADGRGESNYYAPNGDAMKKAFIRAPLDQFRISSSFSRGRQHPVLHRVRKHEGTDFAAPSGTPIKATGDGRIAFRGRKSGYGNIIYINHRGSYQTRYGHMSRFKSGLGVGSRVEQGEVIGYVGMSGLATGPHVHYEFLAHGAPRNPETVDLPGAPALPDKQMADFNEQIKPLMAEIDALDRTQLARNSTGN